jgi:D-3-phosphoglycerate dehydrogenase / 2-oxoglutarate reductase
MYKIQTLNNISAKGLDVIPGDRYEISTDESSPDAILLRSFKMHDMELPDTLKAVGRAGAGVNNIPVDKCSEKGIVVFNTPGANANAVKELVLAALLISSRDVFAGVSWAHSLEGKGAEVSALVEKGKSQFAGPEIKGKTLGVIGLGAIGVMVANDALALGMDVVGYDPFLTVDAAWNISRDIRRTANLDSLVAESDYISMHVPLMEQTKGIIGSDMFSIMKKNVRLLNFSRAGLVNNDALIAAIEDGTVAKYVTDFPDDSMLKTKNVIPIPHLGASTPEAEDNCAVMAANQIRDFLEHGNIINSVNFPAIKMSPSSDKRLIVANKGNKNIVAQITEVLSAAGAKTADLISKSNKILTYNIIDIDSDIQDDTLQKIKAIEGVVMARLL